MQPILMIVVATAASVPLGLWLRHNLAKLGYRNEDEQFLSQPGPRWWVVWTSVLTLGSLAAAAILSREPVAYLPLLPLAVTGPWLAAVDFDVLRIPNRVLLPATAVTTVAVVGVAVAERDWWALGLPVAAAVVTGCVFASVHFATKGGIGFGDTKLAALIGLALGSVGLGAVWLGVLVGSVGALVWNRATRRASPIPYGPWLLLGSWIAALAAAAVRL